VKLNNLVDNLASRGLYHHHTGFRSWFCVATATTITKVDTTWAARRAWKTSRHQSGRNKLRRSYAPTVRELPEKSNYCCSVCIYPNN